MFVGAGVGVGFCVVIVVVVVVMVVAVIVVVVVAVTKRLDPVLCWPQAGPWLRSVGVEVGVLDQIGDCLDV